MTRRSSSIGIGGIRPLSALMLVVVIVFVATAPQSTDAFFFYPSWSWFSSWGWPSWDYSPYIYSPFTYPSYYVLGKRSTEGHTHPKDITTSPQARLLPPPETDDVQRSKKVEASPKSNDEENVKGGAGIEVPSSPAPVLPITAGDGAVTKNGQKVRPAVIDK